MQGWWPGLRHLGPAVAPYEGTWLGSIGHPLTEVLGVLLAVGCDDHQFGRGPLADAHDPRSWRSPPHLSPRLRCGAAWQRLEPRDVWAGGHEVPGLFGGIAQAVHQGPGSAQNHQVSSGCDVP